METYLSLTPFEFQEVYVAYLKKIKSDREWQELKDYRVARWQVFRTLCPPKEKQISLKDLLALPGDDELLGQNTSKEECSTKNRFEQLKEKWKDE